jgi:dipeptidyl aminopeptidase/acylaminoacyl peptidase
MNRAPLVVVCLLAPFAVWAQPAPYVPDAKELAESYQRADQLRGVAARSVFNTNIEPKWLDDTTLAYLRTTPQAKTIMVVNAATGARREAFDHAKVATAVATATGRAATANNIPFEDWALAADLSAVTMRFGQDWWRVDLKTFVANQTTRPTGGRGSNPGGGTPQGQQSVRVQEGQVQIRDGDSWRDVGSKNDYAGAQANPAGTKIIAFKLFMGDRRTIYLLESTPGQFNSRAVLRERLYDQPGDKLDTYETWIIDAKTGSEKKLDVEPVITGGHPWAGVPRVQWWKDGTRALLRFTVRGYQQHKVVEIDPVAATAKTLIDEKERTFVNTGKLVFETVEGTNEIIWRSERDRWGHLYLIDGTAGAAKHQITKGPWVVRSVLDVDDAKRQITFTANGREPGDPYNIHHYRVDFDGNNLVRLTDGNGTHLMSYSPDRRYAVDTYSRVDSPPVHVLRNCQNGTTVMDLERADVSRLETAGVRLPELFSAKGRDGKTDIWGLIVRPSHWTPTKKYPVIENIYAGPHDSHVPKNFMNYSGMHALAELGFIVVQIDGMGTDNRGKDFHDVCWQNIKDAGFPDRIAWMRAAAAEDPSMDIDRVGVYGTSAGGQNSTGALLFHPEFYKVAVSSCGCHDNRMDKYWWNEQWMGYPIGPHYSESSNIDNAAKLQGNLLLMVGELDTNVPPESTYRLVDALIDADKEFEFVLLPGLNHTGGGDYGERKRRDFFVKHLLGVNPPSWNTLRPQAGGM